MGRCMPKFRVRDLVVRAGDVINPTVKIWYINIVQENLEQYVFDSEFIAIHVSFDEEDDYELLSEVLRDI